MFKSNRFWIFIVAVLITVSAFFAVLIEKKQGSVAYIYSDGKLVDKIDIQDVKEQRLIEIKSDNGGVNVIEVKPGKIRMFDSDCPGGDCVRQGWLSGSLTPIVCLPHGLVIQISADSDIDAVVR